MKQSTIPYGYHQITQDDIDAVVSTLKSNYLTQGPKVDEFETKFAEYIGSNYAVAVSNGTAALHLSALALGVKPGVKVITSPLSFVGTSNAVLYCGGDIDFCDIDPNTLLIDIKLLKQKLESKPKGTYSGIIVVDFAGYPVLMDQFRTIADEYNLWLLEDSCHAPGAYFYDHNEELQQSGNGKYADLAIFSFHPVKHIACGEGGMITTNDEKLYRRLIQLRTHGITKDPSLLNENHGGWFYEMQELGYNYRLSDINCSLGISQLKRANKNLIKRKSIALNYYEAFKKKEWIKTISPVEGHAYHLFIILVQKRKELYEYLKKEKIFSQVHYIPIHLQPYYRKLGWKKGRLPLVESYYENCLSIPIYPLLDIDRQNYVISKIINFK